MLESPGSERCTSRIRQRTTQPVHYRSAAGRPIGPNQRQVLTSEDQRLTPKAELIAFNGRQQELGRKRKPFLENCTVCQKSVHAMTPSLGLTTFVWFMKQDGCMTDSGQQIKQLTSCH